MAELSAQWRVKIKAIKTIKKESKIKLSIDAHVKLIGYASYFFHRNRKGKIFSPPFKATVTEKFHHHLLL